MAFLIDWPRKSIYRGNYISGVDRHGFRFDAFHLSPAFWSKGPFIWFLRENWRPALGLVIQLTNFATARYKEWWPYEPVGQIGIETSQGDIEWDGNDQIYAWNRYHMNTAEVITCALMALERWFDEMIDARRDTYDAVEAIWREGRSLAFAGVLISIGKRHPEMFATSLKPLLFVHDLYQYDLQSIRLPFDGGDWRREGRVMRRYRLEWDRLPGRRQWLKEACIQWVATRPDLAGVFAEISAAWRRKAEAYPEQSNERLSVLRWAADFDRAFLKQVTLPNGQVAWIFERPAELRDIEGEQQMLLRLELMNGPQRCSELFDMRPEMTDDQLDGIWQKLQNWTCYEKVTDAAYKEDGPSAVFLDHRHFRCGLLAVLVCLGDTWLNIDSSRRTVVEIEIQKLLSDPPKNIEFTDDDIQNDFEGFMARCVVRCWAWAPSAPKWRGAAGRFVTAFRYRTVKDLFDEAFRMRFELKGGYRELEALALSFSVARRKATTLISLGTRRELDNEVIENWREHWLGRFAHDNGPIWVPDWSIISTLEEFRPKTGSSSRIGETRQKLHRRDYGLEMGVIIAAFGHLPALAEAQGKTERADWLSICRQILGAFCRTLPMDGSDIMEWQYEPWLCDESVFRIVARRLLECPKEERIALWLPILDLAPAAHDWITQFLNGILTEALRTAPAQLTELAQVWREMAEYLGASEKWASDRTHEKGQVWRTILLYGTPFTSIREEMFAPLVADLRPFFERHTRCFGQDAYAQSSLACFLTTKAGRPLLVDALIWLSGGWGTAGSYFWETAVKSGHFASLLEQLWREHHGAVRNNRDVFDAFKLLTMKLAAYHVPIALEIQQQIGTDAH